MRTVDEVLGCAERCRRLLEPLREVGRERKALQVTIARRGPELAKARLRLYKAAQVVFERVLTLMGMTTPERM